MAIFSSVHFQNRQCGIFDGRNLRTSSGSKAPEQFPKSCAWWQANKLTAQLDYEASPGDRLLETHETHTSTRTNTQPPAWVPMCVIGVEGTKLRYHKHRFNCRVLHTHQHTRLRASEMHDNQICAQNYLLCHAFLSHSINNAFSVFIVRNHLTVDGLSVADAAMRLTSCRSHFVQSFSRQTASHLTLQYVDRSVHGQLSGCEVLRSCGSEQNQITIPPQLCLTADIYIQ